MQEWDKDKFTAAAQQDYRLGPENVAGIAREIMETSKTPGEAWYRPVLRKKRARRNRFCQSTPRIEATYPDCRIFSLAQRDQEVGQRISSTISHRTDAQWFWRPAQSDGHTS